HSGPDGDRDNLSDSRLGGAVRIGTRVTSMASMASIAAHCSRFWIIPLSRQTTMARNAPCLPQPPVAKSPEASAQSGTLPLRRRPLYRQHRRQTGLPRLRLCPQRPETRNRLRGRAITVWVSWCAPTTITPWCRLNPAPHSPVVQNILLDPHTL